MFFAPSGEIKNCDCVKERFEPESVGWFLRLREIYIKMSLCLHERERAKENVCVFVCV